MMRVIALLLLGAAASGGCGGPAGTPAEPVTLVVSLNGDGTLTIFHEDNPASFRFIANVSTRAGARTMALDPKLHRIFLPTATFGPPPAPTAADPHPRGEALPGTFVVLMFDH